MSGTGPDSLAQQATGSLQWQKDMRLVGLGLSPLPKQRAGFSENLLPPGAYRGPSLWPRKLPCPSLIDKSPPLQSKCHCPFLRPDMHLTSPGELLSTHTAGY